jgi:hypothetical protein
VKDFGSKNDFRASRMHTTHSHFASKAQMGMFAKILDLRVVGAEDYPFLARLGPVWTMTAPSRRNVSGKKIG